MMIRFNDLRKGETFRVETRTTVGGMPTVTLSSTTMIHCGGMRWVADLKSGRRVWFPVGRNPWVEVAFPRSFHPHMIPRRSK